MMTNKLNILTLRGCNSCNNFKDLLKQNFISYNEIICSDNQNDNLCTQIEDITKCEVYPMVVINNTILCIAQDYDELNIRKNINNKKIIYCHSIINMFDTLKKIYI